MKRFTCANSFIFNSILRARGFDNLIDVKGGFNAIKESGKLQVSDYVCLSQMTNK